MARPTGKKRAGQKVGPQNRVGRRPRALPPPESIISVVEFTSPKTGKTYRVIETTERDAYDKVERSGEKAGRAKKKRGGRK